MHPTGYDYITSPLDCQTIHVIFALTLSCLVIVFDILKQEGFRVIPAKSNSIVARLTAVDKLLTRSVDGDPAMLIDPSCKNLINALRGGYRYKVKSSGDVDDKPEKNRYSHIADAFQYACLHADGNLTGAILTPKAKEVQKTGYVWV